MRIRNLMSTVVSSVKTKAKQPGTSSSRSKLVVDMSNKTTKISKKNAVASVVTIVPNPIVKNQKSRNSKDAHIPIDLTDSEASSSHSNSVVDMSNKTTKISKKNAVASVVIRVPNPIVKNQKSRNSKDAHISIDLTDSEASSSHSELVVDMPNKTTKISKKNAVASVVTSVPKPILKNQKSRKRKNAHVSIDWTPPDDVKSVKAQRKRKIAVEPEPVGVTVPKVVAETKNEKPNAGKQIKKRKVEVLNISCDSTDSVSDPDDPGQKSPPLSLNSSFDSQPLPLKQKFTSTPKVGLESKPLHFYLDPIQPLPKPSSSVATTKNNKESKPKSEQPLSFMLPTTSTPDNRRQWMLSSKKLELGILSARPKFCPFCDYLCERKLYTHLRSKHSDILKSPVNVTSNTIDKIISNNSKISKTMVPISRIISIMGAKWSDPEVRMIGQKICMLGQIETYGGSWKLDNVPYGPNPFEQYIKKPTTSNKMTM